MRIDAADLRRVVAGIMHAAGSPVAEADAVAENLVGANLRGHDSHGVIRTDLYVLCLDQGWMLADEEIEVVTDNGSLVLVDGKFGLGQTVGPQACRLGIDRAGDGGLSVVGLRHAGHLGRIGHYAEMAADAGLVSIHFVNVAGGAMVAPYGGRSRRMGTNPVTIGIPRPDSEPAILDFATSIVAEGKAQVAMAGGPAMPAGSLIDGEGNVTTDPTVLYRFEEGQPPDPRSGPGALRALGEHKGSGLSFMCELLAGALLGSGCAGPGPNPFCNGMLSIYLDPVTVDPDNDLAASVAEYVDWFVSSEPAKGFDEVLTPGEPERRRMAERLRDGIELSDDTWDRIREGGHRAGLADAEIDALAAG